MKNYYYIVLMMLLCMIFMSGAKAETTSNIDLTKNMRVGLKELNEMVDVITISNQSLIIGYTVDGIWTQQYELVSQSGYTVTAATHTYLISHQTFGSYTECQAKVLVVKALGYQAVTGSASPGIWKVYIGSIPTQEEASSLQTAVQAATDLTFEVVGDNGLRTLLDDHAGNWIIMENTYAQASFGTNDLLNGVNVVKIGKRSYRGKMEIGRFNKAGVTAINVIGLEEYLYGVVPSEIVSTWPKESLKAQAVAARNFAVYNAIIGKKYAKEAYAICDTNISQVYKGFGYETEPCNQVVNETYGQLIYFGDTVIPAYFFSTSGGHTEASENVWSGAAPYLKGVSDIYETEPEKLPWLLSLASKDLEAILLKNKVSIGSITDVQVSSYSEAGRAMSLKIVGTLGTYEIPKETMRVWLGLNSRKFTLVKSGFIPQKTFSTLSRGGVTGMVTYDGASAINGSDAVSSVNKGSNQLMIVSKDNIYDLPMISGKADTYIFVGEGYGHGVGLSQSGAKGMALAGFDYKQILEYYYTGTQVR